MKRYGIDVDQALRVERTALHLFDQVATAWQLGPDERLMLGWAARLHEVGLVIAHSQYHVHGAYVLENSDIAGFRSEEHTSELQSLMRISYAVFCLKKKTKIKTNNQHDIDQLQNTTTKK